MPSEPCKCIDISHYQGRPNFNKVADAGCLAMIHNATEGTGYSDPDRAVNCSNALKAGLAICTYHFLRPGNMNAQMDFFCDVVDPVWGERMVLDHEDAGVSLDDLHDCVRRLQDKDLNLQITVYSGHVLKDQLGNSRDDFLAENTDLWVCHYGVSQPTWPSGTYPVYSLWQYSDTGSIDGINDSYVDLNEFNGSDENLLKWMGPVAKDEPGPNPDPPPTPDVEESIVTIATQGPVTLIINGQQMLAGPTGSSYLRQRHTKKA